MEKDKKEDIATSENNEELETKDESKDETEEESNEEEVESEDSEDNTEDADDTPTLEDFNKAQAKLKELEEKNKQLYARLKKTEKVKTETVTKKTNENYLTRDEAILLAKGYDEDDIESLRKLAGNGNLVEASKDPMFLAYKKEKERQEKAKKSQLGASGAGVYKGQKPVGEMTEKEHRALFYKSVK